MSIGDWTEGEMERFIHKAIRVPGAIQPAEIIGLTEGTSTGFLDGGYADSTYGGDDADGGGA